MIIDSFPAFKEIELAQFRMMYLSNLVDLTIIAEARLTQSGLEKPLYFKNWLANQNEEFKSRVVIIEVPLLAASSSWEREIYTREYLFDHIKVNYPSAKFILSDLDEIPSLEQVESLRTTSGLFHFLTPTFYRKINWKLGDQHIRWSHGVMGEVALNIFPNAGRFSKQIPILKSVPGAHFSFISCRTRELFILFAIEKFLYFLSGVYWMMYRSHSVKFNSSPIEWLFMRVYWIGDLMFGVGFFIYFNQNN